MARYTTKKEKRIRRHMRLRRKVSGTAECPRLAVCATSKHFYAQFIDDEAGRTLAAVSTLDKGFDGAANVEGVKKLGVLAAEKAAKAEIKNVVFDRGGFRFHGKVKAFADAVRECGVKF